MLETIAVKTRHRWLRIVAITLALTVTSGPRVGVPAPAYEINVILPLTGTGTFLGQEQQQALQTLANTVNKRGGIRGTSISFNYFDDQSNPQVALQIAQTLIEQHVSVILGPSLASSCGAITPIVARSGPVLYCMTNAGHPAKGGYVFASLYSSQDILTVTMRYFRERGWTRIAYLVSTDATGQDAEQGILNAVALPENQSVKIVDHEYFATNDMSVQAQMSKIKAANPQALIAWATGTPAGTIFHATHDAGLDIPTTTSPGNLNAAFIKQYTSLLPSELYLGAVAYFAPDVVTDRGVKRALDTMTDALASIQQKPDQVIASTWDPTMLVIDALEHTGTAASPAELRDYLLAVHGWSGVNGIYDFRNFPQRGIGQNAVVMVRWDMSKQTWLPVSKFGGALLSHQ